MGETDRQAGQHIIIQTDRDIAREKISKYERKQSKLENKVVDGRKRRERKWNGQKDFPNVPRKSSRRRPVF